MPLFNLKKFRLTQTTLTQKQFALKVKCSRSTVSNIEAGIQAMSDNLLNKIGVAFGMDVEPFKSYSQKVGEEGAGNSMVAKFDFENLQVKYLKNLEEKNQLLEKYNHLLEKYGIVYEAKSDLQDQVIAYEKRLQKCEKT